MEKKTERKEWKETEADKKIERILNQEFPLPLQVERAKEEAFEEIRNHVKTEEKDRNVKAAGNGKGEKDSLPGFWEQQHRLSCFLLCVLLSRQLSGVFRFWATFLGNLTVPRDIRGIIKSMQSL